MYRPEDAQMTFEGFNQSCGMQLNQADEWVRLAHAIDWARIEVRYQELFPSRRGRPAIPARQALGALIIQRRMELSDRQLIKEITRNPYYQYFIGLERFHSSCPFRHGILPEFRKRFSKDFLMEINEIILEKAAPVAAHSKDPKEKATEEGNLGTMILDATCSPSNIRFPQDFSLLNEAREKLDFMIDLLHAQVTEPHRPRTYRRVLRAKFLSLARSKKRTEKKTRAVIRLLLCAVLRNLSFVDAYLSKGGVLDSDMLELLKTIRKLYAQQKEMFDSKIHRTNSRIVSITQPHLRPIVRGKAKTPVEFGAKYDVSVDEKGHARLEYISFEPYNEGTILQERVEKYKERTGHYPRRILVDQIYRTRENRKFCSERGIKMSGRKAGAPSKDPKESRKEAKEERKNETDRIEIERFFSVDKRCCGAGLIMTKLSTTTLGSIALSVLVANLFGCVMPFFSFYFFDNPENHASCHIVEFLDSAT